MVFRRSVSEAVEPRAFEAHSSELTTNSRIRAEVLRTRDEFEYAEGFWCVEVGALHRPPIDVFAVRIGALAAIEIDAQLIAFSGKARVDRRPGDAHKAVPGFVGGIDAGGNFTTGLPDPALFVRRVVEIYVEVNPLGLWRDFPFLIVADVLEVVADEDFCDVPVPELVGFGGGTGVVSMGFLCRRADCLLRILKPLMWRVTL